MLLALKTVFSFFFILHLSLATDALPLKSVCIYFLLPSSVSSSLTAPCSAKGTQSPDTPTELLRRVGCSDRQFIMFP